MKIKLDNKTLDSLDISQFQQICPDYGSFYHFFIKKSGEAHISIRKLKGENRPINKQEFRKEALLAYPFVSEVVIFEELSAANFLRDIKPNIWVKGGDYTLDTLDKEEVLVVRKNNGEIIIFPTIDGFSTTNILNKVNEI